MSDTAIPTEQSAALQPPAASAELQADVDTEDTRTARVRITDHLLDTEGPQHVTAICQGTGLSRVVVDPLLSRMTAKGQLLRVAPATYELAPEKAAPELPPAPTEVPRADGIPAAEWLAWLWDWRRTGKWDGPGNPPDKVDGIMTAGCAVPLDAFMRFKGELSAVLKQQQEDAALRDKLLPAAGGNVRHGRALDDVRALKIMLASGLTIDDLEYVVRQQHDLRFNPKAPALSSWADLFQRAAKNHALSALVPKIVARWNATLAEPGATTAASPTLKRALSEIAPQKPAGAPEPAAGLPQPSAPSPAQGRIPDAPAANPDVVAPETASSASSTASLLLQRYGGTPDAILDRAVAEVSDDDDDAVAAPAIAGRDQIINAFRRNRAPSAPTPPSRPPADRDAIASQVRDRRQADGAAPVTAEGGRAWFANPQPEPPSPSTLAYDELTEAFAMGHLQWSRSLWGPPPNEPGTRVPVGIRRRYGFA